MREIKFSYSVIGDNTRENREWLEKVGYKVNHSSDDRFLRTYEDGSTKISHFKNWIYEDKQPVNCIGNSQLFQAVSAIREDIDHMQLFYIDVLCGIGGQMVGSEPKKRFWSIFKGEKQEDARKIKATLTELQEKFKL